MNESVWSRGAGATLKGPCRSAKHEETPRQHLESGAPRFTCPGGLCACVWITLMFSSFSVKPSEGPQGNKSTLRMLYYYTISRNPVPVSVTVAAISLHSLTYARSRQNKLPRPCMELFVMLSNAIILLWDGTAPHQVFPERASSRRFVFQVSGKMFPGILH